MKKSLLGPALALVVAGIAVASCTVPVSLGHGVEEDGGLPPAFVDPDAGDLFDADTFIRYCPSDTCPRGFATCEDSLFPCEADLLSDKNNCGACGNACPADTPQQRWACLDGRCTVLCSASVTLDCDGIPDNGCEVVLPNDDHCGVCGHACPADKPCIDRSFLEIGCGCPAGKLDCAGNMPRCVDPETDDDNCGACGNVCPPDGDGGPRPPNTYYGCGEARCDKLKCNRFWADCDGQPETGCETFALDDANCGTCGNACADGQRCVLDPLTMLPYCACPDNQTFCGGEVGLPVPLGFCRDLSSDRDNCGACGNACPAGNGFTHTSSVCDQGLCRQQCLRGWGDCNGTQDDGCEVHIDSDPNNCGACGRVCDAVAGQACVHGECVVEPCDPPDAGGPTR